MRIVHVTDAFAPDIGGIETQVQTLALRQRDQGHHVTVITAVAEPAGIDSELDVVRAARGRWLTVACPWRNWRVVAQTLDAGNFDVMHAHYTVISPMAIYVSRSASRRGIPIVVTVHSLWWKIAIATRLSLLPFGWGRLQASWSAVSSVAAGRVRRTLRGVGDVRVVPNLVETEWWQRPPNLQDQSSQPIELILVGRLKKRKHIDEFLDALSDARARLPQGTNARVTIVGEGPRRGDLETQIAELKLSDWVRLIGQRDATAIRDLLHSSDIFVVTSRQESFGLAALEARSAGLPVLGYLGNGLVDFIEHDVDGLLVADPTEMTDTLVSLLCDRHLVDRLQLSARNKQPSISVAEAMRAVEDLYRSAGIESGVGSRSRTSQQARVIGTRNAATRTRAAPQ